MNIITTSPATLSQHQVQAWISLLPAQSGTESPFFHPTYVRLLAELRPQVEVGLISDGNRLVGVFPFERHRGSIARPLGIKLADFQGLVAQPELTVSPRELLDGCGLTVWHFDHLLTCQANWAPWHAENSDSPYLDLSQGYEEYAAERRQAGTAQVAQTDRKLRKLEREIGPVRFEWHTECSSVFQTLLRWKSAQRQRTGTFDILQFDWVAEFLNRIRTSNEHGFEGVLSALYVKDELIAAHLGMRTESVFHHWFPVYDAKLYRYSPGLILLLKIARAAAERGVRRMDLGKGDDQYKFSFRSGGISVATGAADVQPMRHSLRNAWFKARRWVRQSPLRGHLNFPKRFLLGVANRRAMG